MTALVQILRFLGRVLLALSFDIDRAWRDLTFDTCPDTIPTWVDDEAEL